jgi:methanogenic corrinoid protein MtbC1
MHSSLPVDVSKTLDEPALLRFVALQAEAINAVTERFYATHGAAYARFGDRGREACREDLAFHLEFLRPVLDFGLLQPMVDYLVWLNSVLTARSVPADHLGLSLDWLGEFFTQTLPAPEGAAVAQVLAEAHEGFLRAESGLPAPVLSQTVWAEAAEFAALLVRGESHNALTMMHRMLDSGHSLIDFEMHVIQPAMYQIGEQWQQNQISVAQEHMASAIVQMVMTVGLVRSPPPAALDRRVLLACVEGNQHALGLLMVSDAFALAGWQVQYLGANVPTASLVAQIVLSRPHLVGLSVSFPQQLRMAKAVIEQLTAQLGSARPAVMVGGLAVNRFSRLTDVLGADASGANARFAVAQANLLTPSEVAKP